MQRRNSEEFQRLLESVEEWFNQPKELDLRRDEVEGGLSEAEQAFVEQLPTDSRLLDIGCATGRVSIALARQGHTVIGIDIAEKQIVQAKRIARKERSKATFQHYEPPTLPFPDASFDAALLLKTYCYVPQRTSRIAFLAEIARVLCPNGRLFMSQEILDPIFDRYALIYDDNYRRFASGYETLEEGDNFTLGTPNYIHFFMEADLRAELKASPFHIVETFLEGTSQFYVLHK